MDLFRRSAVAEIEHREQARAAVGADDHAQTRDGDFPQLGKSGAQAVPHRLGVRAAVRLQDVDLQARGVLHLAQVMERPVQDGLDGGLAAPDLFGHVQGAPVGHIEHGLDGKHGAHQGRRVGDPASSACSPRPRR